MPDTRRQSLARACAAPLALLVVLAAGSVAANPNDRDLVSSRRARARKAARVMDVPMFAAGRGMHGPPIAAAIYSPKSGASIPFLPITSVLRDEFGLGVDGDRVIGVHQRRVRGVAVPIFGCMACHTGRAAGQTIVGLGNKNVDPARLGEQTLQFRHAARLYAGLRGKTAVQLQRRAEITAQQGSDRRWANRTQGLAPTFVVLKWLYDRFNIPICDPTSLDVKVPHLWGYATKAPKGKYCDGIGIGDGWMAFQEISAGQTLDNLPLIVEKLRAFERATNSLLPPRYPFSINRAHAQAGALVFGENCARCHGTYERDQLGFPIYKAPHMIPIDVVGTDPVRFALYKPEALRQAIRNSEHAELLAISEESIGYFSPRLDGIWSRFPYLHNASVPSLWHMLTPPNERPTSWSLKDAGERHRFDSNTVGLTLPTSSRARRQIARRGRHGARDTYWTGREGQSNQGHPFGTDLPDASKRALIEYLKTL